MWRYPPRSILAAVDFREASASALSVAGTLARTFDAQLTALHAESFEAPPYFTREQLDAIEEQRKRARHHAAAYLSGYAQSRAAWPSGAAISEAPPADAILDASRNHDMVVMGTHGRRGPARWWAGSVAERVIRESAVPVLVVRAAINGSPSVFSRIGVIAQAPSLDQGALKYARSLANKFGGTLVSERSTCLADMDGVTLVVLGLRHHGDPQLTTAAERAMRDCHHPLLFVPSV